MGHRLVFLAGLLALATTAACDNNKAKPEPPTSKSQTANTKPSATPSVSSGTATAPSAAPSVEVGASGKMAHCPSSVTGASTDVKDVPNGVELTVTASGDAATADIRARTQALLESAKAHSGDKHTGNGGGGGTSGRARCPVVLKDTSLLAADVPGGTKITVTTPNPKELDWLRRETRDRLAEVKEGAEGAGAHRMMHCPSAVEGATTKVTNIKEGVVLAVTAKDPKIVAEIRERAKHALNVSAHDAGGAEHTGEGTHHGEIGKCPIVFTGTTLEAKDLPDGTQITVKAKNPAEVASIQDTTKKRTERILAPGASGAPSASAAPSASTKH